MFRCVCPKDGKEFLLDCQSDILDDLDTRFVVPLLASESLTRLIPRLNPSFDVNGERRIMATQGAATIPCRMIGKRVGLLADHHDTIIAAFDMLITGY